MPNAITGTEFESDMLKLAAYVKENGVAPYEGAAELDIRTLKLNPGKHGALKNVKTTLQAWLKDFLKKQGLENNLEMNTRGDRIFLVGK
jgi:hypothetical protein